MNYYKEICVDCGRKFKLKHDEMMRDQCDACLKREYIQIRNKSAELLTARLDESERIRATELPIYDQPHVIEQAWNDELHRYSRLKKV